MSTKGDTVVLRIAADSLRQLPQGAAYWARGNQTALRVERDTTGELVVSAETAVQCTLLMETTEVQRSVCARNDSAVIEMSKPPNQRRAGWREARWTAAVIVLALLGVWLYARIGN
jgi:hypothetical protein